MDFRTFARTLAAHWKLVVAALLACLFGAATVTVLQTKNYQSSATILISFSGETDLVQMFNGTQAVQERLSSYAALAGGRAVAERAIERLHLGMSPDALVSQTHVEFTPKSTLFTITVNDTNPKRAADLAGAMADSFASMVATFGAGHPVRPAAPTTTGAAPASAAPSGAPTLPAGQTPSPGQPPDTQPGQTGSPDPTPDQVPVARATVVDPPTVPDAPISPVPMRNMAMGLVAGVLLGIGVALTREATDRSVRTRHKLEQLSGLPTLAELPGHRGSAPKYGTDISFDDAVRGFRAQLLRAIGPEARRVLLAAPFGGEGTTTTALNLARSLTELGEEALLVEGDTRRPVIASLLNVESGEGLSNALADPDIALEAVRPTSVPKLNILAARAARRGTLPSSGYLPEVLDRVLQDVSVHFDRVVVDGPPVLATADAGLLAGAVQATVLVVRAGRTTVDELNDALTVLRAAGGEIVGTVLTDARVARHTKASARTYRSKVSASA